ncbi:metal ABC transporter permease [Anaeromicrobium sediminis]|uniref:ABC transporter n=1 Tax=Anaeromicrobium sediminis TaxID=1478221 RepID=A0A267MEC1_9FIRM|nr:metal ABC transporter permease [Anaeromicrobium sediminis]PAB57143.1 ABC transporter [Anaeromicrobium sediminis]
MDLLLNIFSDYTLRIVALGSALLGITSGAIGCYAVLRKQSLIGDAVSHAALPGIGLSFLLIGSKNTEWLLLGAFISGWIATFAIGKINRLSRIKYDNALAMSLAVFFGFGLVILTYIQKIPNSNQAGLEKFLFGQASTLLQRDVVLMGIVAFFTLLPIIVFWKEFKLLSFDPNFADTIGFSTKKLDILLTTLIVISIIVGLQTVGVILMSAMLIAPAVAARQWTDRLSVMVILSSILGAIAGICGTFISSSIRNMPTGPIIVVVITIIVFVSLLVAPNRGLIWKKIREAKNKKEINSNRILSILYALSVKHDNPYHPHDLNTIIHGQNRVKHSKKYLRKELKKLKISGLVGEYESNLWAINEKGIDKIKGLDYIDRGESYHA